MLAKPENTLQRKELVDLIKKHEGCKLVPYKDTLGNWTVGYGRLLSKGISQEEAEYFLNNDINEAINGLNKFLWFNQLDTVRQDAIIDLTFNIGLYGVLKFRMMLKHLEDKNFPEASKELLNSTYAQQVGKRANELAFMLSTGKRGGYV